MEPLKRSATQAGRRSRRPFPRPGPPGLPRPTPRTAPRPAPPRALPRAVPPVVELGELVALPAAVVGVHVLRRAQQVARLVVGVLREEEVEALDDRDEGLRGRARDDDDDGQMAWRGARGPAKAEGEARACWRAGRRAGVAWRRAARGGSRRPPLASVRRTARQRRVRRHGGHASLACRGAAHALFNRSRAPCATRARKRGSRLAAARVRQSGPRRRSEARSCRRAAWHPARS